MTLYLKMGSLESGGSSQKTSRPAPAIVPLARADARASRFTRPPRDKLIKKALGCIAAKAASFIKSWVSEVTGKHRTTKSDRCNNTAISEGPPTK